ncbi:hypothetical protein [Kitasatospora purpeofusca]|uniref:Uncharacterized protein n=1 Tax=Kitasatospora purpeofusca TaxID=67352 RepID=A0ABZ1U8H0_9ACTN|nr:hypothetical protein [Kitasatospora purpeofusca]
MEEFNQAVRRPDEFGGLSEVARLLDRIAASEQRTTGSVWIPDTNARLAPSAMLRGAFLDSDIYVIASQYGEDAHRRGWLRLDRRLTPPEHAVVVNRAVAWSETDRSLYEILAEFGPPSVTFGPQDPYRPKTLSYATDDPSAPVVAFHLGSAQADSDSGSGDRTSAGAVLLAVRVRDDFLDGWELTPSGLGRFH